jgi:hypothetical protein
MTYKTGIFCGLDLIWFLVFNATFSNISAISWRPVLVVEEAGVSGENHRGLVLSVYISNVAGDRG